MIPWAILMQKMGVEQSFWRKQWEFSAGGIETIRQFTWDIRMN